jgi:hypothetical protein
MKWFLVVMTIANGTPPQFDGAEMPSKEDCFKSVETAKMQISTSGEYGNVVAIYCASGTPQISSWTWMGKLKFAIPQPSEN